MATATAIGVGFTREEVERARRYHRPLYAVFLVDLVLSPAFLGGFAFTPIGDWLFAPVRHLAWWAGAMAYPAMAIGLSAVLHLPLSFWRSHVHEQQWGFSTQSVGGWFLDRAKGVAVGAILTSVVLFGFVALARAFPTAWPAVAGPVLAGFVLLLSFVAPVILEPIFLRFRPLADPALVEDLRGLARRAGVPVRDVLVADASRRTRKENAYVSGLGRTRRIVVFDTLLGRARPPQLLLVVAHELGHRRLRHVAKGTILGMAGAIGGVLILWSLLSIDPVLAAARSSAPGDPRVIPFILLTAAGLQLLASPAESALSRRWESEADRFSLELTGDLAIFEESFRDLARTNLSDLDPPRLFYLLAFSHPTPPERIAAARRWATARS